MLMQQIGTSLRARLSVGSLGLTVFALVTSLGIDIARTRRLFVEGQRETQEQALRRLAEVATNAAEQNNDLWVIRHMKATAGSPGVAYLAVTDAENRVRLHTDLLKGDQSVLGKAWRTLPEDRRQTAWATDLPETDVLEWSAPVPLKGRWHGMAYIGYDRAAMRRALAAELRSAWLAYALAAVPLGAAALLLAHLLATYLQRRLVSLEEVAKSLGSGDGEYRAPVTPDELGSVAGALNLMADRIRRSQEMKEESLASIAHDLKAPLSNILAFIGLFREQAKGRLAAEDQGCLSSIVSIVHRMSIMIQELLDLARLKAGQIVMRKSPTAVADLAKEALKVIEPTARDLGVKITVDVPGEVPAMLVDPLLINRVLVNLLANAIRFTPQGGRVGINAALRDARVEVLVADNGTGIPPEQLPTLFTRFQQVPEAMGPARQAVGTGLGLAVCKAIVNAHGGDIWVQSPEGGGTVIGFALPIR